MSPAAKSRHSRVDSLGSGETPASLEKHLRGLETDSKHRLEKSGAQPSRKGLREDFTARILIPIAMNKKRHVVLVLPFQVRADAQGTSEPKPASKGVDKYHFVATIKTMHCGDSCYAHHHCRCSDVPKFKKDD